LIGVAAHLIGARGPACSNFMRNVSTERGMSLVNPLLVSEAVADDYDNRSVATVNDHEIRMSVMTGSYGWHRHPDSDESFLVLDGRLIIELEDQEIVLDKGDLFTVPRGVLHRTRADGARSVNLTFEKRGATTIFVEPRQTDR
jgi:quercetin dioxygenase-like cupin family protein